MVLTRLPVSANADGTKTRASSVAPVTPPAMVMASGGQKPPPSRIRGMNPAIVVTVVARTWRDERTTTSVAKQASFYIALGVDFQGFGTILERILEQISTNSHLNLKSKFPSFGTVAA